MRAERSHERTTRARRLLASGLLLAIQLGASPTATTQRGSASTPSQTDRTVTVARGARLTIENDAGDVIVRGWHRDVVRVRARHAHRTRVAVRTVPSGIRVTSSSAHGSGAVDYEIDIPSWMPVRVDGYFSYIAIEGMQSEVTAETVRGDVGIKGGATLVQATSVEGDIKIADARGRIIASSINQGVTIADSSGDIVADTVNGPIRLMGIGGGKVDASTVNGHVMFDGTVTPSGKYRLSTHNGDITVTIPESSSASFSARTYNGTLHTNLPLQRAAEGGRGRQATLALGSGRAEFEVESFGGTISLKKAGDSTTPLRRQEH